MPRKIYIIRHLKTEYNLRGVFMGQELNPPILESEIKPFEEFIATISFEMPVTIFSSPARRSLDTAELVAKRLQIPKSEIMIDDSMKETNYGDIEGLTHEEVEARYPKLFEEIQFSPSKANFPNGETFLEAQRRAWKGFTEIRNSTKNNIIFVSHIDTIKCILTKLLDIPFDDRRLFSVDNGSITTVEEFDDRLKVIQLNNIQN